MKRTLTNSTLIGPLVCPRSKAQTQSALLEDHLHIILLPSHPFNRSSMMMETPRPLDLPTTTCSIAVLSARSLAGSAKKRPSETDASRNAKTRLVYRLRRPTINLHVTEDILLKAPLTMSTLIASSKCSKSRSHSASLAKAQSTTCVASILLANLSDPHPLSVVPRPTQTTLRVML